MSSPALCIADDVDVMSQVLCIQALCIADQHVAVRSHVLSSPALCIADEDVDVRSHVMCIQALCIADQHVAVRSHVFSSPALCIADEDVDVRSHVMCIQTLCIADQHVAVRSHVLSSQTLCIANRLVGLVVKASASRAEDPNFESSLRRDFSGSSHTSDLKFALQWLPCQAPGVIGSALGLVGPVSIYCGWV